MVYSSVNGNIATHSEQVKGIYLQQGIGSGVFQVDFLLGLKEINVNTSINTHVQWVDANNCLFINGVPK
jgi:hypothetical protein